MNPSRRRIATIQVDIDPFWYIASCYQANRGVSPVEARTVYETAIPIFLEALAAHGLKATFFVVGKDMEDPRNLPWLERLLAEGHELANHSHTHRMDFKRLPAHEMAREVDRCAELMERALGVRPAGFKAPAYAVSPALLEHLEGAGYLYDSSVHPNVAIPLVKMVQTFWLRYEKGRSEFGSLASLRAPLAPYHPAPGEPYAPGAMRLVEAPTSTMPLLRLPFHFSFVNVSTLGLYRLGIALHKLAGPGVVNYAFHAVDVLDRSDVPSCIAQRPGMARSRRRKRAQMDSILADLAASFEVLTTRGLVESLEGGRA